MSSKIEYLGKFHDTYAALNLVHITPHTMAYCGFLQSLQNTTDHQTSESSVHDNRVITERHLLELPINVSPKCFDKVSQWCDRHGNVGESESSEDEDSKFLCDMINKYKPNTKISPWDTWFFKGMKMPERLELAKCADFLGNEKMLHAICVYIANYVQPKTINALRKIFGVTNTGFTKAEEEKWNDQYGWAFHGCIDDRGEDTEAEEELRADAAAELQVLAEDWVGVAKTHHSNTDVDV